LDHQRWYTTTGVGRRSHNPRPNHYTFPRLTLETAPAHVPTPGPDWPRGNVQSRSPKRGSPTSSGDNAEPSTATRLPPTPIPPPRGPRLRPAGSNAAPALL